MRSRREWSGIGVADSKAGKFLAETTLRGVHVECHEVVCLRRKEWYYSKLS